MAFVARGFYVTRAARVDRFENFRPPLADRFDRDNWRGPSSRYDKFYGPRGGFDRRAPMCGGQSFGGRGIPGYGFLPLPFMFFGGFLRLVLPLAVLAAVGYFAYKKGKHDGSAEVFATSAPAVETVNEVVEIPKRKGRKDEEI